EVRHERREQWSRKHEERGGLGGRGPRTQPANRTVGGCPGLVPVRAKRIGRDDGWRHFYRWPKPRSNGGVSAPSSGNTAWQPGITMASVRSSKPSSRSAS